METGISNARATGPPEAASTPNPKSKSDTSTRHESARADVPDQKRSHSKARRPNSSDNATGGGRGGRGGRPGKKRDMGRSEWAIFTKEGPWMIQDFKTDLLSKKKVDKRKRIEDEQAAKRQRLDEGKAELPIYATKFSDDVLAAEERRPKKKVAVLIGYAGTGYKGMQLAHDQKTIEGDLFQAFVAAGAISKANADDPKKSSFVRCARTDKGVHAAGNVISLKLIVEEEDIIKKINDNLTPQIRVWGFERTNNSFSAYQLVDSRIYEYLIPTHSFLPPHPSSFLGRHLEEWAEKKDDVDSYRKRQEEVSGYWEKVDEEVIKPILAEYDDEIRSILEKALWLKGEDLAKDPAENGEKDATDLPPEALQGPEGAKDGGIQETRIMPEREGMAPPVNSISGNEQPTETSQTGTKSSRSAILSEAMRRLRQAYITAKRTYRIPESRLNRIQEALNFFVGTRNYHNYTIQKTFKDPSSKRLIKSFIVNKTPILINGTEWLSMKVHGQSFMMHQIRKMVGMVALVVRCGCDPKRMYESMGPDNISIPKAPSLGLLLERPVFDSYNKRAKDAFAKEPIEFDKFKTEMDKFKQEQIYERMYREEEEENTFGNFFNHVDNFPSETFLFVTSGGFEATRTPAKVEGGDKSKVESALVDKDVDVDAEDGDSDAEVHDAHGHEG